MKTVLQIPLTQQLRDSATEVAISQGFSSLQEAVRVFLSQLSSKTISVQWTNAIKLSEKNAKRYDAMSKDFDNNIDVYTASSAQDLFDQLEDDDD